MSKKQRTRNEKEHNERRNALLAQLGSPLGFSFLQTEAVKLFNQSVVRKSDMRAKPAIENMGVVAGVVSLNEEIEVLVKFHDELLQLNKQQFNALIVVIPD